MVLTIPSRIRSRSGSLLNRVFRLHKGRGIKSVSADWTSASAPTRAVGEEKSLSQVSLSNTEESRLSLDAPDSEPVSRPMGTLETLLKRLADAGSSANREHAAFFTVLQVRFPSKVANPKDYIARAWEVVGRRFPALRAEISPPDAGDPQKRHRLTVQPFSKHSFRSTFTVHPNCPNVDVLFSTSPIRSTATCYWLPTPGQIILRTSHWRADGVGQILLTDVFMSTLASVVERGLDAPLDDSFTRQPEGGAITPSLEDLIRKYVKDPPAEAADADILMDTLVRGGQSIAVPTIPGSEMAVPTACSRAAVRMSPESTAELTRACREQGISMTSALNAAIIRATARYPQDPKADSYVIFAPVDLRESLVAAGAYECAQPMGTYVSGLPLRIEGVVARPDGSRGETAPGKSFAALADELGAFYKQDVLRYQRPGDTSGPTVSLLRLAEPYIERMTGLFATFPAPGFPYPKTPVIGNLGKMDGLIKREYAGSSINNSHNNSSSNNGREIDAVSSSSVPLSPPPSSRLRVADFWIGIESATPLITFHPWSWSDELTLSAAWNDSFYSKEIAVDALEKIMEELGDGLEIDQVSYRMVYSEFRSHPPFLRNIPIGMKMWLKC